VDYIQSKLKCPPAFGIGWFFVSVFHKFFDEPGSEGFASDPLQDWIFISFSTFYGYGVKLLTDISAI
jgi:hypothetical protein